VLAHGKAEGEGGPELRPTEIEEVGGPNRSDEAGKRLAPEPAEQRRAVSRENFRRNHDRCIDGEGHVTEKFWR